MNDNTSRPAPPSTLGEALSMWRDRLGVSQSALAREIGCVPSHISRVESGGSGLSARQLHALAEVLGLSEAERSLGLKLVAECTRAA